MIPAAKLPSESLSARPTAIPAAPSRAIRDVVSTPSRSTAAMMTTRVSRALVDGGGEINQDLLQPAPLEKSTGKATYGVGSQAPEDKNH